MTETNDKPELLYRMKGSTIFYICELRGLPKSINHLAKISPLSYPTLHGAMTGKSSPTFGKVLQLLKALGKSKVEIESMKIGDLFELDPVYFAEVEE